MGARPFVEHILFFLLYPDFWEQGFPALLKSWTIRFPGHPGLGETEVSCRVYRKNPPILHRKETRIPKDHSEYETFRKLTESAEAHGLFEHPRRIGRLEYWEKLLREKGLRVEGNTIVEETT